MSVIHRSLTEGRWFTLTLMEQLGNIGSEIGRSARWKNKDQAIYHRTIDRALELFDLTLDDPRWIGRRWEIARLREAFCDAVTGGKEYQSTLEGLDNYFLPFAFAARARITM